jgi:hypothetical protein
MTNPEQLVKDAAAALEQTFARLEALEAELGQLEAALLALEQDVQSIDPGQALSPWPSVRVGLAPPLALLASALFFDGGVWPLGLLALVVAVTQALLLPRFNRSGP